MFAFFGGGGWLGDGVFAVFPALPSLCGPGGYLCWWLALVLPKWWLWCYLPCLTVGVWLWCCCVYRSLYIILLSLCKYSCSCFTWRGSCHKCCFPLLGGVCFLFLYFNTPTGAYAYTACIINTRPKNLCTCRAPARSPWTELHCTAVIVVWVFECWWMFCMEGWFDVFVCHSYSDPKYSSIYNIFLSQDNIQTTLPTEAWDLSLKWRAWPGLWAEQDWHWWGVNEFHLDGVSERGWLLEMGRGLR